MCRIIGYFSDKPIVTSSLILDESHSLLKQSFSAKEDNDVINADGFGISWYDAHIDPYPGLYRSTLPLWNDINFKFIASKIKSNCFLAHVRSATTGGIAIDSCHPYIFEKYSFVHNGTLGNFALIKRKIINELEDRFLDIIHSQVDSAYLFALIMQNTYHNRARGDNALEFAISKSIKQIIDWHTQSNCQDIIKLNIIITNARLFFAVRFCSIPGLALSMYRYHDDNDITSTIICSEPLNQQKHVWRKIKSNSVIKLIDSKIAWQKSINLTSEFSCTEQIG